MGNRSRSSHPTGRRPRNVSTDAPPRPSHRGVHGTDRAALALLASFLLVTGWGVLAVHQIPLYQVETDLLGEYVPAAHDLLRGVIDPARYTSKGVGYPLMLAGAAVATRGDYFLAARLLNLVAAAAAGWLCYAVFRAWFGASLALAVLAALLVNAAFVQAAVEAGTDLPALALALGSIACVIATTHRAMPPADGAKPHPMVPAAAGLLAGFAVITRSNFAFLPVAGAIALAAGPRRLQALAFYAAGCLLPLAGWALVSGDIAGFRAGDQNAINVAYEFYGGVLRETFWALGAQRFRTLMDVVLFDPPRFFLHLMSNLATRWTLDVTRLMPVWIGAPAVAGLLLGAWRRPGGGTIFAHFALAYATLATVFYLDRFSLFLVPFYASAAAWLLLAWPPWRRGGKAPPTKAARLWPTLRGAVWVALLVTCAWFAGRVEWDLLVNAPVETQIAGEALRSLGSDSAGVIACKPHVPYFAHRRFVPLVAVGSYEELFALAKRSGARFLFYSTRETERSPRLLALLDPGTALPGLEPIQHRLGNDLHYFALYRFTGETFAAEELQRAAIDAARNFAARNPGDLLALTTLSDQLIQAHRPREALQILAAAARVDPDYPPAARFEAMAYLELGLVDSAAIASTRALRSASASSWDWQLFGHIMLRGGRAHEARTAFARALQLDPARDDIRRQLARADSLAQRSPPPGGGLP